MDLTKISTTHNESYLSETAAPPVQIYDDATWILTSTFIIFTMQSGFGLLEAASVSHKNQVNIMAKNGVDVLFGGLSYWTLGYGLSFGKPTLFGLMGLSDFCTQTDDPDVMGDKYAHFFFQASFATTATTIVSGAIAERAYFPGYVVFSFFNTFIYVFPACWIWHEEGFLRKHFHAIDYAGSGAVHVVGGVTALVSAWFLGARKNRFKKPDLFTMDAPVNAILGLFMLWFGWLGFNCGSAYGVSGGKWKLAAKSAITTINGSIGGAIVAIFISYKIKRRKCSITMFVNGILSGLVGVTSNCALITPGEALLIGAVSPIVAHVSDEILLKAKIDDPVAAFSVHGAVGVWSLVSVGLFTRKDDTEELLTVHPGLLNGGDSSLLMAQLLYATCCIVWAGGTTYVILKIIDKTFGTRCETFIELFGADMTEHGVGGSFNRKTREVFDADGILVGVAEKDATNKELFELLKKLLDQHFDAEPPHPVDPSHRRSITDLMDRSSIRLRRVETRESVLNTVSEENASFTIEPMEEEEESLTLQSQD